MSERRRDWRGAALSCLLHLVLAWMLLHGFWPKGGAMPAAIELPVELVAEPPPPKPPSPPPLPLPPFQDAPRAIAAPLRPSPGFNSPAPRPIKPAPPADPLTDRLESLSHLSMSAPASRGNGAPLAGAGGQGGGLLDLIREQVERRWILQSEALTHNDWVVRLHLRLRADGKLMSVDVVDDARLIADRDFRDFAFSARNAARLASPFLLPPLADPGPIEVMLDFNPRRGQQ